MNPVYWPISSSWFKKYSWSAYFARDPSSCWKYWEGSRSRKKTHKPSFQRWLPPLLAVKWGEKGLGKRTPSLMAPWDTRSHTSFSERGEWRIGWNDPTMTKPKCLITYGSCAKNSSEESSCFLSLGESWLWAFPSCAPSSLLRPDPAPSCFPFSFH